MGDQKYLSTVVPDLDAIGTSKNTLYYSTSDVIVKEVQSDNLQGKYTQALTSLTFGSTSEVSIPNNNSISETYMYLSLAPIADTNIVLPQAWGYAAIRSINYTWGASNVSVVELSGESIFQHMHLSCESSEKRAEMLDLAGAPLGTADPRTAAHEAVLILPLPWSTIRKQAKKLGYDTSLLDSNIQVQVTFNDANHFMGVITGAPATTLPNSWQRGEIFLKQDVLTNKMDSMRQTLKQNPQLMVQYPFVHRQNGTRRFIQSAATGTSQEVSLQSFLESDLLGIGFYTVATADERSTGAAGSVANKFNTIRCRDIELLYNGQVVHKLPYHAAELIQLELDIGASTCPKTTVSAAGVPTADSVYHCYYLPMTKMKSVIFEGEYENTSRFANQTMQLRFTPEIGAPTDITFHSMYFYNGICSTSGGTSKIAFA